MKRWKKRSKKRRKRSGRKRGRRRGRRNLNVYNEKKLQGRCFEILTYCTYVQYSATLCHNTILNCTAERL